MHLYHFTLRLHDGNSRTKDSQFWSLFTIEARRVNDKEPPCAMLTVFDTLLRSISPSNSHLLLTESHPLAIGTHYIDIDHVLCSRIGNTMHHIYIMSTIICTIEQALHVNSSFGPSWHTPTLCRSLNGQAESGT